MPNVPSTHAALVGTNGETSYQLPLGDGRVIHLEFPPETIALRIRRHPEQITVERTEDVETWLPVGEWAVKPVAWSTVDDLTRGEA